MKVEIVPRRHVRIWWHPLSGDVYEVGISELVSWLVDDGELVGLLAIEPQELNEQDFRSLELECDQPKVDYPEEGLKNVDLGLLLRWAVQEATSGRARPY